MLQLIQGFNLALSLLITMAFAYQGVLMAVGFLRRRQADRYDAPSAAEKRRYAAVISARNEEAVIGELIESLKDQDYPPELLDIYVVADNCTDNTAACARRAGAVVYERFNTEQVGKGYALDYLFGRLRSEGLEARYAGYFVFDADNIVDRAFVRRMNDTACSGDFAAITCYRNSKNFGANWISAGYSLWFLREARFLNFPRMLLGTNCTVSGTGFLISADVIRRNGGWPFHLLTEDLQFSADCAAEGWRIGYCDKAVIYDEQPTRFRQSWDQRLRWTKGFYQVAWHYAPQLIQGIGRGGKKGFSCYDVLMIVAPGSLLTVSLLLVNLLVAVSCLTQPGYLVDDIVRTELMFLAKNFALYYCGFAAMGAVTAACEWDRIRASRREKLLYLITFPFFMMTYIPIAVAALRRKVEWKPIEHHTAAQDLAPRRTPGRKKGRPQPLLDRTA
ncbi:MAG TPA: glycosyltransferase [Firmicutes bacterium]|nr:glycosyltransferase [Bacillota bacterium]